MFYAPKIRSILQVGNVAAWAKTLCLLFLKFLLFPKFATCTILAHFSNLPTEVEIVGL